MIIPVSQYSESTVGIAIARSVDDTDFLFRIVWIFNFENIRYTSLWYRSISYFCILVFWSNCLNLFITTDFDTFQSITTEQMACSCFTTSSLTIEYVAIFDGFGKAKISFFKISTKILNKFLGSFVFTLIIRERFILWGHFFNKYLLQLLFIINIQNFLNE